MSSITNSTSRTINTGQTHRTRPAAAAKATDSPKNENTDLVLVNFRPEKDVKPAVNFGAWTGPSALDGPGNKGELRTGKALNKPKKKLSKFHQKHLTELGKTIDHNNRAWKTIAKSMGLK